MSHCGDGGDCHVLLFRDVLPFTLQLPQAIAVARTKDDLQAVAQLGAGFWDSALGDPGAPGTAADPSQEVCQTPAALCFLNPVFLQELQGDGASAAELHVKLPSHLLLQHSRMPEKVYWIHPAMETQAAVPTTAPSGSCTSPSGLKEQLTSRRSTKSQVVEEMLKCSQSKLLHSSCVEEAIKSAATPGLEFAVNQEGVCWQSDQRLSDVSMSTSSSDSLYSWPPQSKAFGDSTADEEEEEDEGGDVDEDEDEEEDYNYTTENNPQPVKAKKWPGVGPLLLPATLRAPLRRMSGALDSLVDPERRVVRQVQRLARDKTSFFGCLVQDYVNLVLEEHSCHMSSLDLLQTLRQFLTQTKAYLAQSAELEPPVRSLVREHRVDHVLEKAMHKCVLKPLRGALLRALQEFQEKRGEWQQLKANLAQAKTRTPRELGMDRAVAPDPLAIEKIRHKFHTMCKTYSPEKKVANLLEACKIIYAIMAGKSGGQHGADDFLPMLTYILAQCEMPQLDLEIQYMMELLDPLQLNGEGGYYLTSTYAAMCVIRNFEEEQAAEALSLQTDNTLRQWHRRRTTQHRAPAIEDLQAYLRVALQDPDSSCTAKTLQVRADCTAREVCRLCAHKFQVEDPESHALFLLSEGGARQLEPDSLPQLIKAEIHNRPQAPPFHFVYRRVTPAAHL
ncbi:ras and Rab interactor 2-like [Arapaima gigas]